MMAGPGSYLIEVELLGYASTTRPITIVGADSMTVPAFVLTESAIRLDSIVANVRPDSVGLEVGFSHAAHLVAGARLALLERHGVPIAAVLRQLGGVRVREILGPPRGICVTSNRAMQPMSTGGAVCAVAVVDGVVLGDGSVQFLYQLQAYDVESIQYLPPVEAGLKYGMQAPVRMEP
jgi:hypothetical protein